MKHFLSICILAACYLVSVQPCYAQVSWTIRTSAADNAWRSVTYGTVAGNGLFVAVASSGTGSRVMTSPDGINWTSRTSATDNQWRSVTYGTVADKGLFVAVAGSGTGNRVMTSPDGINWTSRTSAVDNFWNSVTYGNGLFVAVASSIAIGPRVMTSPDGITWTSRTAAADNAWLSVTYGAGLFVAVAVTGTGDRVMTSPDGINWTSRTSAVDNEWRSVTYGTVVGNGLFVAVATSGTGNRVMTSPDGITWTSRVSAANNFWFSVTYAAGLFVAVSGDGSNNRVMTSPDGINWTSRTSAADNTWNSVTSGNGLFVAVASSGTGNRVMTSAAVPLPVNLLYFRGKASLTAEGYANELTWATASEVNFSFFEVERSENAKAFEKIGKVDGNKGEIYEFIDKNSSFTIHQSSLFYRLKMVDLDGTFAYSKIIALNTQNAENSIGQIYPNPSNGESKVNISSNESGNWTVSTFDITGKLIGKETICSQKGVNVVELKKLGTGMNYIQVSDGKTIEVRKVIKN